MREMKDSGVDWIGNVPSEWRNSKVKHIASFYNGDRSKAYPSGDDIKPSGVPFLTSDNVHGLYVETGRKKDKFISDAKYRELNGAKLQIGDIVFCLRGSLGACGLNLNLKEGTVASSLTVLRPNQDEVIPEFLNYCLHSPVVLIQTDYLMNGSCADNLSAHSVGNYCICIPPMQEQCQITRYLDERCAAIDDDIAKRCEVIEKLKEYKRSLIAHAVTKGLDPNAEMKASGIKWTTTIPSNWQTAKLKTLFEVTKRIAGVDGLTVLSITQDGIKPKDFSTGKGQFAETYSNYQLVRRGDFAMNHMDLLTGWVDISSYDGVTSPDYRVFVARDTTVCNPKYFLYLFQMCYLNRIFFGSANGVADKGRMRLQTTAFNNFLVPLPTVMEQTIIADFLDERCADIDEAISRQKQLIEKLGEYRKSIIHNAVTGKTDCTEAAK